MTTTPGDIHVELAPTSGRAWTPAQREAIESRSRTLVAAAAGSGKTSVLTELVASALADGEIDAAQVCAVTFTEKAAQEMRGRIADRLVELDAHDVLAQLELARIGTIHSLCAAILRLHGAAVGVDPDVGQLDEAQHAWILRESMRHVLDELGDDPDVHWLRARTGDERIEATIRSIYSIAAQGNGTAHLVDSDDVSAILDAKTGEPLVDTDAARRCTIAFDRLWRAFHAQVERRKRTVGRISFDDLERLAVEAARIPDVRSELRGRWGMLLVDEFQDTNARQYELLDAIGGDRLFMVGDEWQSIYRFRGADVDVFRARRSDTEHNRVVPMRENFRSVAPVLDVVNRIFSSEELFGDRYEPVIPGTDEQRAHPGPSVDLIVVPEQPADDEPEASRHLDPREREARRVAERVAQLVRDGADPGSIALLYARGTGVDHYERALRAWGLPVLRDASSGFYDQRDVRDVLALLALVRNRRDDHAALAALAGPVARLDWTQLGELAQASRERQVSLLDAASASEHDGARMLADLVSELTIDAQRSTLVQLVARIVRMPRLELGASIEPDGAVRVANLRRLVELAASAAQVGVRDVSGFLEFVASQRNDARVGEASIADEHAGAIRLMTIHASKGLEFPHVFVIEAAARDIARSGSVPTPRVDASGIVHVALPKPDGRCVATPTLERLKDDDTAAEREESLRLWYVAMTRARTHLYVTGRWNFVPTRSGSPRAMAGALAWLRDALELPDDLGGADRTSRTLDGLVQIDTCPPRLEARPVLDSRRDTARLAAGVDFAEHGPGTGTPVAAHTTDAADPAVLRSMLRDSVLGGRTAEWRQLEGTRLHDAVARLLDAARAGTPLDQLLDPEHGPWLTDTMRERLAPVVESAPFTRLVELGARSEVPYVARVGGRVGSRAVPGHDVAASVADVDAGRIDALAVFEDGRWWIVDWKSTLPDTAAQALVRHGEQLGRYAHVATATGAAGVVVTLVALDDPSRAWSWSVSADGTEPQLAELP